MAVGLRKKREEFEAQRAAQAAADAKAREESLKTRDPWAIPGFYNPYLPRPVRGPVQQRLPDPHPKVEPASHAAQSTPAVDDAGRGRPLWAILRRGETRYMIDPDPTVCLNRICQYALNMAAGTAKVKAKELFERFRFDDLYADAEADWSEEFESVYAKLARAQRGRGLPLFVVERAVRDVIPKSRMVYNSTSGTKRQDLQPVELAYVLKSIVSSLRKRGGKRSALMSRAYFLVPEYRLNYKTATRRQLNTGKLARITDLLNQHGFVVKVRKSKFAPLQFRLGLKASLIPPVPVSCKTSSARGRKEGR